MSSRYTFTGEYNFVIDSKKRINVPSAFRKQLKKSDNKTFVITRGVDDCVWVYPLGEWKKIEKELSKLSSLSSASRAFLRNHLRHANIVSYDDQGRIILSKQLIDYANIAKEVTIIGVLNKIEIWDKKTLISHEKNSSINDNYYEELSRKVTV